GCRRWAGPSLPPDPAGRALLDLLHRDRVPIGLPGSSGSVRLAHWTLTGTGAEPGSPRRSPWFGGTAAAYLTRWFQDLLLDARITRRQAEEMANPFVKFWKYLMAAFSSKIDEHADPKVQIQQAIEEAQRQHQALSQQAAAVIGNQRQLEMKLNRQLGDVERLQASARQALVLADQARAGGDEQKAAQYEQSAQAFATQLVTAEQAVEDLKSLHDSSLQAATQAKQAVERNAMVLQQKIAERTK